MEGNLTGFGEFVTSILVNPYSSFLNSLPENYRIIFNIFVFVILLCFYSIFVFAFYKFLARKNILKLNLSKYNTSEHPSLNKFLAAVLFIVEYIIILPALVFFWFAVLAFLLLLLSKEQTLQQILLVSAAIVGAVRVTSYFSEEISRELAKLFPLTTIVIFLLSPSFLDLGLLTKLTEIPSFLTHILIYIVFIVGFEIFIRLIYTLVFLFKSPEEQQIEEVEESLKEVEYK